MTAPDLHDPMPGDRFESEAAFYRSGNGWRLGRGGRGVGRGIGRRIVIVHSTHVIAEPEPLRFELVAFSRFYTDPDGKRRDRLTRLLLAFKHEFAAAATSDAGEGGAVALVPQPPGTLIAIT